MNSQDTPTQFGIFYPTGYIMVAFPKKEDADKVRQDLRTGGVDEHECMFIGAQEVQATAREHLENAGALGTLGASAEFEREHLRAAEDGCVFLRIYAPHDVSSKRVMRVVRRVPFTLAHRYHRLAIEVLE